MELIVVVMALAFLQVWGSRNPLHYDGWFQWWRRRFLGVTSGEKSDESAAEPKAPSELQSFQLVAWPLLLLVVVYELVHMQSSWAALPLAVIVLLYSFGRGEFFEIVREYTQACYIEDWDSACERASGFGVDVDGLERDDWPSLHRHVLDQAGYRGFERMFAVLFWFFVLGPVRALM